MITNQQKQSIIDSGKSFFRTIIIPSHLKNLNELKLKDFNVNPFLINYLAAFLCGNTEPESLASMVIPKALLPKNSNQSIQPVQTVAGPTGATSASST